MNWKKYTNAAEFTEDFLPFLETKESLNNLMLGVVLDTGSYPEIHLFGFFDKGQPVFAIVHTPPHHPILYGKESVVEAVATIIHNAYHDNEQPIPGVIGPRDLVEAFTSHWCRITGCSSEIAFRQMIYQLTEVKSVDMPSGQFRAATSSDLGTLKEFYQQFAVDTRVDSPTGAEANAQRKIDNQQAYVWEDTIVVSTAAAVRPTRHNICIAAVFTARDKRGLGYGTAVVAKLSQHLLDQGYRRCALYTDLANPTSNRIYRRIGYQEVGPSLMLKFIY